MPLPEGSREGTLGRSRNKPQDAGNRLVQSSVPIQPPVATSISPSMTPDLQAPFHRLYGCPDATPKDSWQLQEPSILGGRPASSVCKCGTAAIASMRFRAGPRLADRNQSGIVISTRSYASRPGGFIKRCRVCNLLRFIRSIPPSADPAVNKVAGLLHPVIYLPITL